MALYTAYANSIYEVTAMKKIISEKIFSLKKFISLSVLILILCTSAVFASPDTVSPYDEGNATDLISVTKPEGQKDSTFDNTYVISGYGKEGTVVTLYYHDTITDMYQKIFNKVEYAEADDTITTSYEEASTTIGASGLFMNTVIPAEGENNILIRAENGESVQYLRLSITKYKRNIIGIIKSWTD